MPATVCLWFDGEARAAAEFYTQRLRDGRIGGSDDYRPEAEQVSGQPAGSEMTVEWEAEGIRFLGLNGGPQFPHSEAVSFMVFRDTQEELDATWNALLEQGGEESQCGWLTDRFGVSWQVVPTRMSDWVGGPDREGAGRAVAAMLKMRKLVIADLEAAYAGTATSA